MKCIFSVSSTLIIQVVSESNTRLVRSCIVFCTEAGAVRKDVVYWSAQTNSRLESCPITPCPETGIRAAISGFPGSGLHPGGKAPTPWPAHPGTRAWRLARRLSCLTAERASWGFPRKFSRTLECPRRLMGRLATLWAARSLYRGERTDRFLVMNAVID